MPTKRLWTGHATDRPQIDQVEFDEAAATILAEGTDLEFQINGKTLAVENPHPLGDEDTATAGDTSAILTLLQLAEAAINGSTIPEIAELEAQIETFDSESPYHRMLVTTREQFHGWPFAFSLSAPNPTIDIDPFQVGAPGQNEKQSYYTAPAALGGAHRIRWNFGSGVETSGTIPFDGDADDVKAAMIAGMPTITGDNVIVTGSNTEADPFEIELTDDLAETGFGLLAVDVSELTGNGEVTISTIQDGGSGGAGSNIVTDAFTDTNGTALTSHTADTAQTWSNLTGTSGEIQSNKLEFNEGNHTAGSNNEHRLSGNIAADFAASATLRWADISFVQQRYFTMGLVFRYSDSNNYWYVQVSYAGSTYGGPRLSLLKVEGGSVHLQTYTTIGDFDQDEDYEFTVTCQGNSIEATFGPWSLSWTSSFNSTAQIMGIMSSYWDDAYEHTMTMDDLVIDSLAVLNEKWVLYTNGSGGTFDVDNPDSSNPQTLSAGDSTANVKSALETLYGGTFTVTGGGTPGDPWITDAGGALAGTNLTEPEGDGTNLTGGFDAIVDEVQDGSPPLDSIWDVIIHATTSGNLQFELLGRVTGDIAYGATAGTVLTALQNLAPGDFSTGIWTVIDTGIGSADYRITCGGRYSGAPQTLIAHNEDLVGTALGITHTTIQQPTGRNWIDNPANYRDIATGLTGLPVTGDELFLQAGDESNSMRFGSLAGVEFDRVVKSQLFHGHIGLPEINPGGYAEYRDTHITLEFQAGTQSFDNPNILIGIEQGQGSGLVRLKTGTDEVHIRVEKTGGPVEDGRPSFCWDGQNTSSTLQVIEGFVGTAVFAGIAADLEHVVQRGGLLRFGELTDVGTGGFDRTGGETFGRASIGGSPIVFGN